MKLSTIILTLPAALVAASSAFPRLESRASNGNSGKVPAVTIKGNAFFAGNERFYIRGVDYQPGGSSDASDPIADVAGCKRDVASFKKLGINTVRVYTVDNTAKHDECMNMLAEAGIYLALDVNTPKYSLNRAKVHPSYNSHYLQSVFATIDAFAGYDNTLLFFSGNEVINDDQTTDCAPYVKAVTRDMKQYIRSRGYRQIPVGYSAADVESNRYEMAQYMDCGTDDQRSDFFAFNDYSWCYPSSFTTSGWNQKVDLFRNYSLPIFLSEYGCITNGRSFEEVEALYGSEMTPVYSGGLIYEYSEEANGYGLVKIKDSSSVEEKPDFAALQKAFAKTKTSGDGGYQIGNQPATCPSNGSSTWHVKAYGGQDLPAMPSGAIAYLRDGAGKGPGLAGSGSQNAGGESSSTAKPGSASSTASPSSAAQAIALESVGIVPVTIAIVVGLSVVLGTQLL